MRRPGARRPSESRGDERPRCRPRASGPASGRRRNRRRRRPWPGGHSTVAEQRPRRCGAWVRRWARPRRFPAASNQERSERARPVLVEDPDPVHAGRGIGATETGSFPFSFSAGFHASTVDPGPRPASDRKSLPAVTATAVRGAAPGGKSSVRVGGLADDRDVTDAGRGQRRAANSRRIRDRPTSPVFGSRRRHPISSRIGVGSLTSWAGRPLGVYRILAGSMPSLL